MTKSLVHLPETCSVSSGFSSFLTVLHFRFFPVNKPYFKIAGIGSLVIQCNMAVSREPENVIVSRQGSVLGKKTILKSDHFPGCQNKRLLPHVEGAPNYRQVDPTACLGF